MNIHSLRTLNRLSPKLLALLALSSFLASAAESGSATSSPAVSTFNIRSFGAVESEQNGHTALLAANAQIPSRVGFGPLRNIQRISLPPSFGLLLGAALLLS